MSEWGTDLSPTSGAPLRRPPAPSRFAAVVMGASAGGHGALTAVLRGLSVGFALPILVVQHLHASDNARFAAELGRSTTLPVIEPLDKEPIVPGHVYIAPANYHMLVERDATIALSVDERVRWSRPSINVLFESAARVWTTRLIGVILSGANDDGAEGMQTITALGGLAVAQDPATAEYPVMPRAAIQAASITTVLSLPDIAALLCQLGGPVTRGDA